MRGGGWPSGLLIIAALACVTGLSANEASAQQGTTLVELRHVAETLFTGDPERIEELLRFATLGCVAESGIGLPPVCPEGVLEGTPVEAFPTGMCKGGYVRSDSMKGTVARLSDEDSEVLSIYEYEAPPDAFLYGDFVVLATVGNLDPPQNVGGVFVGSGGITGLHRGCADTAESFSLDLGLIRQVVLDEGQSALQPELPPSGQGPDGASTEWAWLAAAATGIAGAAALALARLVRKS